MVVLEEGRARRAEGIAAGLARLDPNQTEVLDEAISILEGLVGE